MLFSRLTGLTILIAALTLQPDFGHAALVSGEGSSARGGLGINASRPLRCVGGLKISAKRLKTEKGEEAKRLCETIAVLKKRHAMARALQDRWVGIATEEIDRYSARELLHPGSAAEVARRENDWHTARLHARQAGVDMSGSGPLHLNCGLGARLFTRPLDMECRRHGRCDFHAPRVGPCEGPPAVAPFLLDQLILAGSMEAVNIFADQLQTSTAFRRTDSSSGRRNRRPTEANSGAAEGDPFADSPLSPSASTSNSNSSFPIPDRDIFADDYFGYTDSSNSGVSYNRNRADDNASIDEDPFMTQEPLQADPDPLIDSAMDVRLDSSDAHPARTPPSPIHDSPSPRGSTSRNQPGRWTRHSRTLSQLHRDQQGQAQAKLEEHLDRILHRFPSSHEFSATLVQKTIRAFIDTLLYSTTTSTPASAPSPIPGSPSPPPDLLYLDPEMRASYCLGLLDSPAFSLPCIPYACAYLFDLAEEECETERRALVYELLLATSQIYRDLLSQAHDRGMCTHWFRDILEIDDFWTQRLSVALLWQVLANRDIGPNDLDMVDDATVNRLLDLVEMYGQDGDGPERPFVHQVLLLLARIDAASPGQDGGQRQLIRILTQRRRRARAFEENIISLFIHEPSLQARSDLLTLFAGLFAQPETGTFFYTNDLSILIDVLIRDLWDLGEEETHVRIQTLMVLALILERTQWVQGRYKHQEISRTLDMLGRVRDPSTAAKAKAVELILEWL
ncbi:hypothetical protein BJ684DRAFT_20393 [Piptocephalis cylindrospora]|uniref:SPIN90/Ldb17 leucine-rich domain-containing protein n=1 Tax=Piptocephalis cylindrospora TaxID=1907219 RepID=A0A4P9Y5M7_9FUNG|nr:hypothetical protein BJ684DRAFT_20393 [Piptocephalis cylindrospora]|eukprot:RKP13100.1 hypothetical protein BJ684DRAFT_20393 [Piptocephalis cylindrospora]